MRRLPWHRLTPCDLALWCRCLCFLLLRVCEVFEHYPGSIVGQFVLCVLEVTEDDWGIIWKVWSMIFIVLSPSPHLLRRGQGRAARRGRDHWKCEDLLGMLSSGWLNMCLDRCWKGSLCFDRSCLDIVSTTFLLETRFPFPC